MSFNAKSIITLIITVLIFSSVNSTVFGENVLQELKTLKIYIKNKEYGGGKFLGEDGMLYTSLEDLKQPLKIDCNIITEEGKDKLYINAGEEEIEYIYAFIKEEDKIFVPLTTFVRTVGYEVKYDERTNVLDIFLESLPFDAEKQVNPDENSEIKKKEVTDLTVTVADKKFDGAILIIRSRDEKYFNFVTSVHFFAPLNILLYPGKYKLTVKRENSPEILQEENIDAMEGIKVEMDLK